jgi:predicted AlkP superfamily pyrophosphatase or phosphodiesterase
LLVLIDGLGFQTAVNHCGYLEGRVRAGRARRTRLTAELPSMSRPLYETVHTGVEPVVHGITSNDIVRRSTMPNIFSSVREAGGETGAAAFSWFSELYNRAPFDPLRDGYQTDAAGAIRHGIFYAAEETPDREVIQGASALMHRHAPDYMLLHPMGCDHLGHLHGGASPEYRTNATRVDSLLATFIPTWEELGYRVMVTADHGMNADGYHGGTLDDVRHIPFYDLGADPADAVEADAPQTAVAPTVLAAMGLPAPETMKTPALA